jgi:chromosome segregation ATPase
MNTTVKIFIVLNLVLAMAFLWIQITTYAYRENYKRRWNEDTQNLSAQLKQLMQDRADDTANLVATKNELALDQAKIAELQATVKQKEDDLAQKDKEIQSATFTNSKQDEEIKELRENYNTVSNTLELTRQSNNEKTRIAQVARAVAFQLNVKLSEEEDNFNNVSNALQQREEALAALTKEDNERKAQLAILRERYPKIAEEVVSNQTSAAFVQGVVAAVRSNEQGQQDLVMITVGKDAKVEEGVEFIISRGPKYIVKVRTERVLNDMAACRVIPDSWNSDHLAIQDGDLAQNRL